MTAESPDPPPSHRLPPSGGGHDTDALFGGVAELCERILRSALADGAALAVLTRHAHTRELAYATDTTAVRLDELPFTLGEGPCVDAYLHDAPQFHPHLDSVTHTSQWPTFATEATQLGVRSLFAFPIPGARRPTGPAGVLELYRRAPGNLTEDQRVAAQAGATAIGHRLATNWDEHRTRFGSAAEAIAAVATTDAALDEPADAFTRTQIHIAAGMLAIHLNTQPDEALDRLRAHSFASGRRISSVAADIIAKRLTLDDEHDPPHQ